jgi:hypothetical protein
MARVERGDIGLGQLGRLGELGLEPVDQRLAVAVEHPERQPQRPHVLAAQRFLVAEPERLHGIDRQLRDVELEQLPFGEAAILERIGGIFRLVEVALAELALVGDDQPAGLQRIDIGLERRRVHRDQHVGRSPAVSISVEPKLIWNAETPNNVPCGARISAGKSGKVAKSLPGERGRQGELAAGQLHAVAGIAGKADDDRFGCGIASP